MRVEYSSTIVREPRYFRSVELLRGNRQSPISLSHVISGHSCPG